MRFYVNVDHVATVREARRTDEPDPVRAAVFVELAGADGITVHLREDRRHVSERDVRLLMETVHAGHGLTYENVTPVAAIAPIEELNIGHSIVSRAVLVGMERAVREMRALIREARSGVVAGAD